MLEPDIQMTVQAEELAKALEYLTGISAGKDPDVKRSLNEAARFLISRGKQRLSSRHSNTGGLEKRMIYEIFRNKKGVKLGFNKEGTLSFAHHKDYGPANKWFGIKPWIYDLGSYKGNRHTKKGYNRGMVKGTKFWTDTNEQDSTQAMQMIQNAIQRSINKIMST